MNNKKILSTSKILLFIIVVALAVRVVGVWHGFPFLYHPDEPTVINEALVLPARDLNPGHFDWPHLHFYVTAIVLFPIYLLHWLMGNAAVSEMGDFVPYFLAGRLLTVVMGTITVFLAYVVADSSLRVHPEFPQGSIFKQWWRGFDTKVRSWMSHEKSVHAIIPLLAAALIAFNTSHAFESHMATLDVPMTMWLMLSLYFSVRIAHQPLLRRYLLAGLFAGLATSTKYNAGLSVVAILGAHWFHHVHILLPHNVTEVSHFLKSLKSFFIEWKLLVYAAMASLIGFFVGTPFALFDYRTFISTDGPEGALWQFVHVGSGGLESGIVERYIALFSTVLVPAMGWVAALALVIGVVISLRRVRYRIVRWVLLPFALLYLFYVGTFSYAPPHFFVPVYPVLSIFSAIGLYEAVLFLSTFFNQERRSVLTLLVVAALIYPVGRVAYDDYVLTQKDTRTLAYEWVNENIPEGSGIVLGNDYEPDLDDQRYDLYSIHQFLLDQDLSGPIYPKFNDRGIRHGVLGGFDLEERLDTAEWNKREPEYPDYLLDEAKIIKRFDPVHRPGPVVMIFEIGFDYEVLHKHKE